MAQKFEMANPLENVAVEVTKNCTCEKFYKNYRSE